jgi:hypothetical protein
VYSSSVSQSTSNVDPGSSFNGTSMTRGIAAAAAAAELLCLRSAATSLGRRVVASGDGKYF